ncbi:flagellar hook-basal body protein [Brevibacillus sp. SYP-B805]|uniref:flagellar hook-basal body protein n=1 Tax=Brevibacillus sp. SYP-B805 TaxID=1578199 RepID=UPI0013EDFDBD|nr:flagellar hook-basal body protein [Brevibacillus sp. SYP-B805]NGQ95583.1 flagellar hook-basal body protein [Brevibacillus sp. SYP-B805]
MIRGLYTAASGMLALQRRQETLANNIANINTPGYKEDEGVLRAFPEQLIARIRDKEGISVNGYPVLGGQPVMIGRLHTGVYMPEALPNFRQGDIEQTDNPYDVALLDNIPPRVEPDGKQTERRLFFSVARLADPDNQPVANPEEIRYTRNGQWQVNAKGYLVTSDGYYVLDSNNSAIRVNDPQDPEASVGQKLKISETGELLAPVPNEPDGTYQSLGAGQTRLGLKVVTDPNQLVREGNNLYRWAGQQGQDQPANAADDPQLNGFYGVKQGWVERSNVNATQAMTDMMTVVRAYEANQRVISTLDGTLEKAANEIGRVTG